MNLFDELAADAKKDLESGKFLQGSTEGVTLDKQIENVVDGIEKKMSDAIDNTMNKIMSSQGVTDPAADNDNNVPDADNENEKGDNDND